jgi:hypothetical protein
MKRQRGRGRKPGGGGGGGGGGGNNHNHGNRSLESNGPDVKIRGTAAQIYEKYAQFARDAQSGGDRVKYETYLQHAEHYYRVMAATMPRERLLQQQNGEGGFQQGQPMGEAGQQQPNEDGVQGGGMQGHSHGGMQGGGEQSSDSMRPMDNQSVDGDDGDDDGEGEGEGETTGVQPSGQSSVSHSSGSQASGARSSGDGEDAKGSGDDGDRQGQSDADGSGRNRRRRGRRRNQDGDRPNAAAGGNTGGDTEARSALDSLARKQGALAGG